MSYCGECGDQLLTQDKFCPQCGSPVPAERARAGASPASNPVIVFFRKHKWLTIGTAAFLLVLTGLYLFGREMTSESRYLHKFEAALKDGDAARVAFMLKTDNAKVTIDEAKAKTILAYIKTAGLQDTVIQDLNNQAKSGEAAGAFLVWEKDGRQFGIYDKYRIVVLTSMVEAHTNFNGAAIKLNGKTVATADSEDYTATIGPLVPGIYKVEAEYAGEYTTLKTGQELTVGGGSGDGTVDLSMAGEQVSVDSNYTGAAIFIDDKDTGAVTGFGASLGPVALDGSNKVHVEKSFPWGTVKSGAVPIDSATMHVELNPNTDELKATVMKTAAEFLQSWIEAYNKLDPSVVRHLAEDHKTTLASGIDGYKTSGLVYKGQLKKLVFDTDSIYIQPEADGLFRTTVSLQNTYTQSYYADGETPPEPTEYTDTFTYRLIFEKGQWIITDWYEEYNFKDGHTKEMTF